MQWWIWLIIAFGIGILEVTTFTFVLLWFAIAAFITTLFSFAILNIWVQLLIFAIVGMGLFLATRPMARRWRQQKSYPDRTDSLVGRTGVVVTGEEPGAFATVKMQGELWTARSNEKLEPGQKVIVRTASATVLTVDRIREDR